MVGFGDHPSCLRQPVGRAAEWPRMVVITLACLAPFAAAAEEKPPIPRPITVIEAGTVVDDPDRDRWNRIVLLATPRFTCGDTADDHDALSCF